MHASRTRMIGCGAVLALAITACSDEPPADADPPPPIAGTWIRIYPREGALDTLVLHEDGRISGSTAGLDSLGYERERWRIGAALMPGGLCIGQAEGRAGQPPRAHCQGYLLRDDTLWFANQSRTVLVRAPTDGRPIEAAPWASPRRTAVAPRPGDSVRAAP